MSVVSSETPTHPDIIQKYANYLRTKYIKSPLARPVCLSPSTTTTEKYIDLSLVRREKITEEKANNLTHLTLQGDVDQILQDSKQIELDDILKVDDNTRLVVVEGAPGIGKSTLAWELCRQWSTMESMKRFSLVVLIRLQEEGVQSATDISDLFYHANNTISKHVGEEVEKSEGDGVLFVFDGFDQLPAHYRNSSKSLLIQIITGEKLLKTTVLVTSRPSAMSDLQSLFRTDINRHIEILGFSQRAIQQYVESIFESNSDILFSFNIYLLANPVVKGMMYNPLNSAIVVGVYLATYESGKPVPHTQTQLYTELTWYLLLRYMNATGLGDSLASKVPNSLEDLPRDIYQQLVNVGMFAFEEKLKNEMIFKELPEGFSDLGLLVKHTALYAKSETTTYSFFHLTHQEFISAFYISQLSIKKQRILFNEHNTTSMDVVWRFVAGLTKMQSIGWDDVKRLKVEKQIVIDDEVSVHPLIIQCVYEAQDVQSCSNVFGEERLSFISDRISNFDLYALGYCISLCANIWNISVRTSEVGFSMLVHGMKSVEYGGGSIEELNLARSRGIDDGRIPHHILKYMKILNLKSCVMDKRVFENLAEWISYMPNLTSLDISYNPGGDRSLVKLLHALREYGKLQRLYLQCIAINSDDVTALADLVQSSSSLRELEVDGSNCGQTLLGPDIEEQLVKTVLSPSLLEKLTIYADVRHATSTYIPILGYIETISASITSLSLVISSPLPTGTNTSFNHSSADLNLSFISYFYEWVSPFLTSENTSKQTKENTGRVKGGSKLSHILRGNTSLQELKLYIPLDKDELQDIIDLLKDNHSLRRLELSEIFHSKYFSLSERQLLDGLIVWAF